MRPIHRKKEQKPTKETKSCNEELLCRIHGLALAPLVPCRSAPSVVNHPAPAISRDRHVRSWSAVEDFVHGIDGIARKPGDRKSDRPQPPNPSRVQTGSHEDGSECARSFSYRETQRARRKITRPARTHPSRLMTARSDRHHFPPHFPFALVAPVAVNRPLRTAHADPGAQRHARGAPPTVARPLAFADPFGPLRATDQ